ncbi:MAG: Verru_Chthon cassette protein B [Terrimicrobiaceae bacterium]
MKGIFRSCSLRGFSLVEVTLAMGIASFAVIGVLSLVPGGLATLRSSVDASAVSRIMRTVAADARQSTNFTGIVSTTNYFDDNGLKLDPANKAKSIYSAQLAVLSSTVVPGAGATNTNLKAISVRVARAPGAATNAFSQGGLPCYVLWISKSQ